MRVGPGKVQTYTFYWKAKAVPMKHMDFMGTAPLIRLTLEATAPLILAFSMPCRIFVSRHCPLAIPVLKMYHRISQIDTHH